MSTFFAPSQGMTSRWCGLAVIFAGLGWAAHAAADEAPDEAAGAEPDAAETVSAPETAAGEEAPWAEGVTPENREAAEDLLARGNQLFLDSEHREALATYREALAAWDHPAIRFNIVRALIHLDRPVEAYENLEAALRFGAAPLADRVYQEARNYERLLLGQLAEIEISCGQEGVEIRLDGQAFMTCPGTQTARTRPGERALVATKPNFLTLTREIVAMPGEAQRVEVRLIPLEEATVTERYWKTWQPWSVAGGGVALAGIGVLLRLQAQADMDQYGRELGICADTGCTGDEIPASTHRLESRARIGNGLAIGAMITGGLAAAAGLTGVVLNRPRSVIPESGEPQPSLSIVPSFRRDAAGLELRTRF